MEILDGDAHPDSKIPPHLSLLNLGIPGNINYYNSS